MPVLSATDSISPAFRHTVQQMFKPFRLPFWLRLAVLGLFTGEVGGGGGAHFPSSFHTNSGGRTHSGGLPPGFHMGWFTPAHIAIIAIVSVAFLIVFTLIFTYINSIFRFILFDAVLHGNARIVDGWRKWRATGRNFFVWQILLAVVGWLIIIALIGFPLLLLFTSHHIGIWHIDAFGIAVLIVCGLVWMAAGMVVFLLSVIAKDFIVPMMALEGITWQEGWSRFRAMASGHASEYAVFYLMKIVLRIGAGIAHGIVVFIPIFILMIPGIIAVVAGVAIGANSTAVVKALLITIGIIGGLIFLLFVMAFSALAGAPIAFFFPAYAIYFFAGRYGPLGAIVFPPPPPAPVTMPEAPPIPG